MTRDVLSMSEPSDEDTQNKVIIIQMLLEHEKRLKRMDYELSLLKEDVKKIETLKDKISNWVNLSEKLSRIERWNRKNIGENL